MKGNFLRVRTGSAAFSYTYSITNPIAVPEPGTYKLTFYTIFNCIRPGCENLGDTLSVKVKQGSVGEFVEVYSSGSDDGRNLDVEWKKEEVMVQLTDSQVFVST